MSPESLNRAAEILRKFARAAEIWREMTARMERATAVTIEELERLNDPLPTDEDFREADQLFGSSSASDEGGDRLVPEGEGPES